MLAKIFLHHPNYVEWCYHSSLFERPSVRSTVTKCTIMYWKQMAGPRGDNFLPTYVC